jgi:hypothetical protein
VYRSIRYPVIGFCLRAGLLQVQPAASEDAQQADKPDDPAEVQSDVMTNQRLDGLIRRLDQEVQGSKGFWQFSIETVEVTVITDQAADRMRIIVPVAKDDELDRSVLYRLLQSNFDTALDARYAIAKGVLWSTFVHPLASLGDEEFLSALGQVVNLNLSYGTTFSSGALIFRGGDSEGIRQRELIDRLIEKGLAI